MMLSISRKEQKTSSNMLLHALSYVLMFIFPPYAIFKIFIDRDMSIAEKIAKTIIFLVFWVYSTAFLFFVFWGFYNSFKPTDEEFLTDMMAFPTSWRMENYIDAYHYITDKDSGVGFIAMFINSLWFAGGSAFLTTFMHAITGYIFAKYTFPGQKIAFKIILISIAIPIVGSLPSLYKVIYALQIQESPLILFMYLSGFGSNFLIMYAFFRSVSRTYMEAAEIDGASRFQIFFKIMLPMAAGPFLSLFILTFIAQWNNYETPILFLRTMPTLSSGLYNFSYNLKFDHSLINGRPMFFAGILMASIPVIILVAIFGNKIMKNVNMGGIKG